MSSAFAYDPAKYPTGSTVRVVPRRELEEFFNRWKLHHRLSPEQLEYGRRSARVVRSFMYHGGDILYELDGIHGVWHEPCLQSTAV